MNHPPPNQLLHCLFRKANSLLANCGHPSNLIILAPVSSSLNLVDGDTGEVFADDLNDEFVQSHILHISHGKDEGLDRNKARIYTTVNGKTMVIKEDVIYPHRGFRGVKEVKMLHDSLFWLDDPDQVPYLVYFLDRPLMGSPLPDTFRPSTSLVTSKGKITTWAGLVREYKHVGQVLDPVFTKLYAEFNEALQAEDEASTTARSNMSFRSRRNSSTRQSRRYSGSSIAPAPLQRTNTSQSFSSSPVLQHLRVRVDLVLNAATQAFQQLSPSILSTIAADSHLTGEDVEKLIESRVLVDLYDIIFFKVISITTGTDEEIAAAIDQSKYVDVKQLGTASTLDLRSRLNRASSRFRDFGKLQEPIQKVEALRDTINVLMRNSEKSSDDLIPSLVYVVLRAGVSNLCANILWIREFAFIDVDCGEYGFSLSTLEAVIYHITSSVKALRETSFRNLQFLNAVKDDEMDLVQQMVAENAEVLEIRDLDDQTPHKLARPGVLAYLLTQPSSASTLSGLLMSYIASDMLPSIIASIRSLELPEVVAIFAEVDSSGQSLAHKIHERFDLLEDLYEVLDWEARDNQGNTPLQVLARIYDHPSYESMFDKVLRTLSCSPTSQDVDRIAGDGDQFLMPRVKRRIQLQRHLDGKGNTLAHIVACRTTMKSVFEYCSGDFNRLNDKGLTPLLISIKFARVDIMQFLLDRTEVDSCARDIRGHSAIHYAARASLALFNTCIRAKLDLNDRAVGSGVTALHIASREGNIPVLKRLIELNAEEAWDWRGFKAGDIVKNDQVRSIMDEWSCRGREVRVLRGHVADDCLVKYLIKSKSGGGVLRSVAEFAKLRHWMSSRYPARGIATLHLQLPAACLLHSRPARSVLLAVTERLDAFVRSLLDDEVINQNPILWEFLLSPTINDKTIANRIEGEVERQKEMIWNDEKSMSSYDSTQMFFAHAREQIIQLSSTYRIFERKARAVKDGQLHLSVAYGLVGKSLANFLFLGQFEYVRAIEEMSEALVPKEPSLMYRLIEDIISLDARILGLLHSLTIPDAIIERIEHCTVEIEKHERSLTKQPRLQLNLSMLMDTHTRRKALIRDELQGLHIDLKHAGSELRSNEATLAGNLSKFYEKHERGATEVLKRFCGRQAKLERERLRAMEKALAGMRSASMGG